MADPDTCLCQQVFLGQIWVSVHLDCTQFLSIVVLEKALVFCDLEN